jgi:hypothetical protein
MEVKEFKKKLVNTKSKSEVEAMIKKMRAEDSVLVKGQFEFIDAEGGFFEFTYRKYPGESIQTYTLIHGEICNIPMGIVKHLNNTKKKIRRYKDVEQPPSGAVKVPRTYETSSRIRFLPVEYL